MNLNYNIDLTLIPTTLDLWHISLLAAVLTLTLLLIIVLLLMVISLSRQAKHHRNERHLMHEKTKNPEIKTVEVEKIIEIEKIVEIEVEKIVQAPIPEPVILKESTPDAALQLLALLQKEARFIDFIKEDVSNYSDSDIGIAARVVHEGCNKAVNQYFTLSSVRTDTEGSKVTLAKGFNASEVRLIGNVVGQAPFSGTLVHQGWQVTDIRLPKLTAGYNASIIAAAEVEL